MTERLEDVLAVPAAAVLERGEAGEVVAAGPERFVWLAEPAAGGTFTVRRVEVEVGPGDGRVVSIRSGLQAGDRVVVTGQANLRNGDPVRPTSPAAGGERTIEVGPEGFRPSRVEVTAGQPVQLTFLRRSDEGCGSEVVFPDFGIRRDLPVGEPVVVEITPRTSGSFRFTCGMDMFDGTVVAR